MVESLLHDVIMVCGIGLLIISYQQWQEFGEVIKGWEGEKGKGKKKQQQQGVTKKPVCVACEGEEGEEKKRVPPPRIKPKRGRKRKVKTGHHYCPKQSCQYYGWLNLGNISSNGHPNGGRSRQLYCSECQSYFAETKGTLFYGKRYGPELIQRVLTALAEGLGIRAVARVFEVEPETVLEWLLEAHQHIVAFTDYLVRELELEQIQMDELFGVIRAVQDGEMSREAAIEQLNRPWLWTAMDPVSKFWLATVVGPRTTQMAQSLVHQVVKRLKEGCVPLFLTDGYQGYKTALLSHYGQWRPPEQGQRKARWMPLGQLHYVQVVKKRVGRRLVSVSKRLVFGSWEVVKPCLASQGWHVNTAFVERLNLSIRQHVSGLGRRVNTLVLSAAGLEQQVALYQLYYNFCLPHAALREVLNNGSSQKWQPRSPAMAVGLTDHIWSLGEVLSFRVPPWPQSVGVSVA